jgi:hypothetical protein
MIGTGKPYRVRIDMDAPKYSRFVVEYQTPYEGSVYGDWSPMWIVTKHAEAMRLAHIGARLRLGWSPGKAVNPRRYL